MESLFQGMADAVTQALQGVFLFAALPWLTVLAVRFGVTRRRPVTVAVVLGVIGVVPLYVWFPELFGFGARWMLAPFALAAVTGAAHGAIVGLLVRRFVRTADE